MFEGLGYQHTPQEAGIWDPDAGCLLPPQPTPESLRQCHPPVGDIPSGTVSAPLSTGDMSESLSLPQASESAQQGRLGEVEALGVAAEPNRDQAEQEERCAWLPAL